MSLANVSTTTPSQCEPFLLTAHQMVGLAFITENAYLSLTADTFIFILIFNNLRRHNFRLRSIFQSPIDIYIFSLITSDLFQGLGRALTIRWIQLGHVSCGEFCTVQGTFETLGEASSAMGTLVIAIHTFWVIAFRKPPVSKRLWVPLLVVSFIWSYVIIFIVIVASKRGNWHVPVPYWCWIGHRHLAAQLAGEYLWLWIAGFASIVLYVPLFFILKGWNGNRRDDGQEKCESTEHVSGTVYRDPNFEEKVEKGREGRLEQAKIPVIIVHEDGAPHTTMPTIDSHFTTSLSGHNPLAPSLSDRENASVFPNPSTEPVFPPTSRLRSDPQHSYSSSTNEKSPGSDSNIPISTRYSLRILLYPIAYTALVLPLSVARWSSEFSTAPSPSEDRATLTAMAIYTLSGFVNAFLVLFSRRSVNLLSPPQKEDNDEESMLGIGSRVDEIPIPFSRAQVKEDEKRDSSANNSDVGPGKTRTRSRPGTSNNERRRGSATKASASGTAVANTISRQEDEHRNRPRKKNPQNITDDSGQIDVRIRTVEVRGEVGLPD